MDEQAESEERRFLENERAKLELLDLTEDVIELILEKKRKTFAITPRESKMTPCDVIPEPEPIHLLEVLDESTLSDTVAIVKPTLPELPMDRTLESPPPISRRPLPWRKR